eukprot:gene11488-13398_t
MASKMDVATKRRQCDSYFCSAENFHCCNEYEFCVSCCMSTDKVSILESILAKMIDKGVNPSYLRNQFDLCTTACRTSSKSLIHQREYKQPSLKFCYGNQLPS